MRGSIYVNGPTPLEAQVDEMVSKYDDLVTEDFTEALLIAEKRGADSARANIYIAHPKPEAYTPAINR